MALIEDMFKGNLVTGLAVGIGAVLLGPSVIRTAGSVLRPAAKAVIKGSLVFYRETVSELGEIGSDLLAEARAELEEERHTVAETAPGAKNDAPERAMTS